MQDKKIKEFKQQLKQLLSLKALHRTRVVLSSGKVSNYYLDARIVTLSSKGAYLIANIILDLIKERNIAAVGGPTLGADPIVGALLILAKEEGLPLSGFIVRKKAKAHGMRRMIEGPPLKKKDRILLVDDVATTGRNLVEAKMALDKEGLKVEAAVVLVDRGEGAVEALRKANCPLASIFKIEDLL